LRLYYSYHHKKYKEVIYMYGAMLIVLIAAVGAALKKKDK
jgi:hypothetical protein